MINVVRTKYRLVLVSAVAIGFVFVWAASHRRATYGEDWLLVSTPSFGSRTNTRASTVKANFRVSNVGPRSVDFRVSWFECRTKRDRTVLATNQLILVRIPLRSGQSTNLTMDVSLGAVPVEECLCCYQVLWFQRESPVRDNVNRLWRWWFNLFEVVSEPPWARERLTYGTAFAANVEVADYFRWMYGFTRTQWLEDLARQQSAPARAKTSDGEVRAKAKDITIRQPTADEMLEFDASDAFAYFCQRSTNSKRDAEPTAPPNAAPPHR